MNKKIRLAVMVLLGAVLVGSVVMMLRQGVQYREGEETYAEAESLADLPDLSQLPTPEVETEPAEEGEDKVVYVDPYADALRNMDFTALREVNTDVLGWIMIPGSVISYPLVQGDDNSYYLKRTWKKWTSVVGSIFMDYRNSPDLGDFNTIIYGHRMNNGSMFASLKNYKQQSYWEQHPKIYITDDNGSHSYQIFAAYEISTEGDTYRLGLSDDQGKQAYIDYCMDKSVIETGVTPTVYDRILTLSTCTGNGHATRWVVQGVLRGEAPSDTAGAEGETEVPEEVPVDGETSVQGETPAEPVAPVAGAEPQPEIEAPAEPSTETEAPAEAEPTPETEPPAET